MSFSPTLLHEEKSSSRVLRLYSVHDCAPCETVKEALSLIASNVQKRGWEIDIIVTNRDDKRAMGKVLLAGVKYFPTVRLMQDNSITKSFVSIKQGWNVSDIASFLLQEISQQSSLSLLPVTENRDYT